MDLIHLILGHVMAEVEVLSVREPRGWRGVPESCCLHRISE